jgi:hypothetical protein
MGKIRTGERLRISNTKIKSGHKFTGLIFFLFYTIPASPATSPDI